MHAAKYAVEAASKIAEMLGKRNRNDQEAADSSDDRRKRQRNEARDEHYENIQKVITQQGAILQQLQANQNANVPPQKATMSEGVKEKVLMSIREEIIKHLKDHLSRPMSKTEIKADQWRKTLAGLAAASAFRDLCSKCGINLSGNPSREKMIELLEKELRKKNHLD